MGQRVGCVARLAPALSGCGLVVVGFVHRQLHKRAAREERGLDLVQWALGTDHTGPVEVSTEGGKLKPLIYYEPEDRNRGNAHCSRGHQVTFRYANGVRGSCEMPSALPKRSKRRIHAYQGFGCTQNVGRQNTSHARRWRSG